MYTLLTLDQVKESAAMVEDQQRLSQEERMSAVASQHQEQWELHMLFSSFIFTAQFIYFIFKTVHSLVFHKTCN